MRRHILEHDGTAPDTRALSDGHCSEDFGADADHDTVFDCRMAFATFFAGTTKRDALIHRDVIANHSRLADHDAHAMVDEDAASNFGAGMDLDPGHESTEMRNDASGDKPAPGVE